MRFRHPDLHDGPGTRDEAPGNVVDQELPVDLGRLALQPPFEEELGLLGDPFEDRLGTFPFSARFFRRAIARCSLA